MSDSTTDPAAARHGQTPREPLSATSGPEASGPHALGPDALGPSDATSSAAEDRREAREADIASGTGCVVALSFRDPLMAQEALLAAMRLRAKGRLTMTDAAVVAKDDSGKVRIQQTRDLDAVQGASSGLWLGVLAGLFVPGGVLIGGALGAALGGLWAKLRDIGISDARMKELGEALPTGHAALFMLVSDAHRYHAMSELRRFPATLFYDTLSPADHDAALEALAGGVVDDGF